MSNNIQEKLVLDGVLEPLPGISAFRRVRSQTQRSQSESIFFWPIVMPRP